LTVTDEDLEELLGFVAAEANHEPNRRRQRRLDTAFEALNAAAQTTGSW
jgi:plasmid stabilization system protein ParE